MSALDLGAVRAPDGFVTLTNDRRSETVAPLASSRGGGLTPSLHGRRSEDSVRAGRGEMTLNVEVVVGGGVEG